MTKSANKSAVEDMQNASETSVTVAGRFQCDEDDYGYESSSAKGLYERLMNKYEANPENPFDKFTKPKPKKVKDIGSTKARVKDRLDRPDSPPSKAKHQEKTSPESQKQKTNAATVKPPKPKTSFADLMKRAKQNTKKPNFDAFGEPIVSKKTDVLKECEFDRPMTEKEKVEYRREKLHQSRRQAQEGSESSQSASSQKKPGPLSQKKPASPASSSQKKPVPSQSSVPTKVKKPQPTKNKPEIKKPQPTINKPEAKKAEEPTFNTTVVGKLSQAQIEKMRSMNRVKKKSPGSPVAPPPPKPKRDISSVQSRSFPGEKGYKGEESKPVRRQRSPSPVRRKFNPNSMASKRRRIESDDEEDQDSEMDDFIDDSEANIDISAEIRGIFGYDRRKFRDEEDFDDRAMENNRFANIMKEEAYSAKIGLQEDLEDMRREEEEKQRKRMKSKRK